MIAVDTNILIYAHRRDSAWHSRAQECVRGLAEGAQRWLIPWPCIHEFVAIVTHPRIYTPASTLAEAVRQIDLWVESPSLVIHSESDRHWTRLKELMHAGKVIGPKVHDARIAAICRDHGVSELWTADRDFSRFPSIRAVNPLIAS